MASWLLISIVTTEPCLPSVQRRGSSKVTALRCERANIAERLDTSKEKLQGPVSSARCIPRKLVASELDLVEGQATLVTPGAEISSTGKSAAIVFGVVGGVEGGVRV